MILPWPQPARVPMHGICAKLLCVRIAQHRPALPYCVRMESQTGSHPCDYSIHACDHSPLPVSCDDCSSSHSNHSLFFRCLPRCPSCLNSFCRGHGGPEFCEPTDENPPPPPPSPPPPGPPNPPPPAGSGPPNNPPPPAGWGPPNPPQLPHAFPDPNCGPNFC